jgi:hypothetical protein
LPVLVEVLEDKATMLDLLLPTSMQAAVRVETGTMLMEDQELQILVVAVVVAAATVLGLLVAHLATVVAEL